MLRKKCALCIDQSLCKMFYFTLKIPNVICPTHFSYFLCSFVPLKVENLRTGYWFTVNKELLFKGLESFIEFKIHLQVLSWEKIKIYRLVLKTYVFGHVLDLQSIGFKFLFVKSLWIESCLPLCIWSSFTIA